MFLLSLQQQGSAFSKGKPSGKVCTWLSKVRAAKLEAGFPLVLQLPPNHQVSATVSGADYSGVWCAMVGIGNIILVGGHL